MAMVKMEIGENTYVVDDDFKKLPTGEVYKDEEDEELMQTQEFDPITEEDLAKTNLDIFGVNNDNN